MDQRKYILPTDLKPGTLYDCIVDSDYAGREACSFVALAINSRSDCRFLLFGAKFLFMQNLDYIKRLVAMSFDECVADDWGGRPTIPGICMIEFVLTERGRLVSKAEDAVIEEILEQDGNTFLAGRRFGV